MMLRLLDAPTDMIWLTKVYLALSISLNIKSFGILEKKGYALMYKEGTTCTSVTHGRRNDFRCVNGGKCACGARSARSSQSVQHSGGQLSRQQCYVIASQPTHRIIEALSSAIWPFF